VFAGVNEGMSRGLKPALLRLPDARAEALAYLRGKGNGRGNGKGEIRRF
jgi:hypothetical protein